jgi:hypothetical protein
VWDIVDRRLLSEQTRPATSGVEAFGELLLFFGGNHPMLVDPMTCQTVYEWTEMSVNDGRRLVAAALRRHATTGTVGPARRQLTGPRRIQPQALPSSLRD